MLADKSQEELLHLNFACISCMLDCRLICQQIIDVHTRLGLDTNVKDELEHLAEATT